MTVGNLQNGISKLINTATTTAVKATQGSMIGIFCTSSTAGTVAIYDDPSTTNNKVLDTTTLAAATYYPLPISMANGMTIVTGGTINIAVIYN